MTKKNLVCFFIPHSVVQLYTKACTILFVFFLVQGQNVRHDGEDKQGVAVSNLLEPTGAAEASALLPAYILSHVHQLLPARLQ